MGEGPPTKHRFPETYKSGSTVLRQVLVPDLAGWRRERMPEIPDPSFLELPDWVCEVLSPSTAALDRTRKTHRYAAAGVGFVWLLDPAVETLGSSPGQRYLAARFERRRRDDRTRRAFRERRDEPRDHPGAIAAVELRTLSPVFNVTSGSGYVSARTLSDAGVLLELIGAFLLSRRLAGQVRPVVRTLQIVTDIAHCRNTAAPLQSTTGE